MEKYTGTPMAGEKNERIIGQILEQVPISNLIEPQEVISLLLQLYKNDAIAGNTVSTPGGFRPSLDIS